MSQDYPQLNARAEDDSCGCDNLDIASSYGFFCCFLDNYAFKGLKSFGTDGEKGLGNAFSETCPSAIQLRCFIHFKKNLTEYTRKIGIDQFNQIQVCADLLGQQVGKDK